MKLFHQLDDHTRKNAINYYISMVISDVISNDFSFDFCEEHDNEELTNHLETIKENMKNIVDDDVKAEALMADDVVGNTVFDIAIETAKQAYYHSGDDMVVFTDDLECPHCKDEADGEHEHNEEEGDDHEEEAAEVKHTKTRSRKSDKHSVN